jgi:hypothetical protein
MLSYLLFLKNENLSNCDENPAYIAGDDFLKLNDSAFLKRCHPFGNS